MIWFLSLSIANRIAFSSLLVAILSLLFSFSIGIISYNDENVEPSSSKEEKELIVNEVELRKDEIESELYSYMVKGKFDFASSLEGLKPVNSDFEFIFKAKAAKKFSDGYPIVLNEFTSIYREKSADYVGVDSIEIRATKIITLINNLNRDISENVEYDQNKARQKNQLAFYNNFRVSGEQFLYKIIFTTKTPYAAGKDGGIVYMNPRVLYGFRGRSKKLVIIAVTQIYNSLFEKVFYIPES